jgi:hypothetical protein
MNAIANAQATPPHAARPVRRLIAAAAILAAVAGASAGPIAAAADAAEKVRQSTQQLENYKNAVNTNATSAAG